MEKVLNKRKKCLDALSPKNKRSLDLDLPLYGFVRRYKSSSTAYYKEKIVSDFKSSATFGLYFSSVSSANIESGKRHNFRRASFDGLWQKNPSSRIILRKKVPPLKRVLEGKGADYALLIKERYAGFSDCFSDFFQGNIPGVSLVRAWNVSIVSSVIFGMFLMTMIYRYLGQGAYAGTESANMSSGDFAISWEYDRGGGAVLGEQGEKTPQDEEYIARLIEEYQEKIREGQASNNLEKEIRKMTKDYPIEKMAPYIARKDKVVAAFLIGIAKKESAWGLRSPVLDGKDCHNYWGYKGLRERMGSGGHTCFDSLEDAVDTVSRRIEFLVEKEEIDTPKEMVTVWKCGYDCSWDDPAAVRKWVSDVNMYFEEFNGKVD